jgi:putative transposase
VNAIAEALVGALLATFRSRASLVVENLALRQQLAVLRRRRRRPHLRAIDRAFWVTLSRVWSRWADSLAM